MTPHLTQEQRAEIQSGLAIAVGILTLAAVAGVVGFWAGSAG